MNDKMIESIPDYVDGLRHEANCWGTDTHKSAVLHEAADRIEELEKLSNPLTKELYKEMTKRHTEIATKNKELEAQLEAQRLEWEVNARDRIEELQAQLDQPIKIKANPDGQVWITFDAGGGRKAMLNLNNILLDQNCSRFWVRSSTSHSMPKAGITHGICMDALAAAIKGGEYCYHTNYLVINGDNNGKT